MDRCRLAVRKRPADELALDRRRLSTPTGGRGAAEQVSDEKRVRKTSERGRMCTVTCTDASDAPT